MIDLIAKANALLGDDPIATKMLVGSGMVLEALRTAFPPKDVGYPPLFGIPVSVDPMVGYGNLEVRDQFGGLMIRMKVIS